MHCIVILNILLINGNSPGGKVEPGERLEDSLIREIKGEFGCRISIKNHLLTTEHNYDFGTVKIDAFLCELRLDTDALEKLGWAESDLPIVELIIR